MPQPHQRRRASGDPAEQARWASVWIAADRRQPFKIEQNAERPRRRWWGGGL